MIICACVVCGSADYFDNYSADEYYFLAFWCVPFIMDAVARPCEFSPKRYCSPDPSTRRRLHGRSNSLVSRHRRVRRMNALEVAWTDWCHW